MSLFPELPAGPDPAAVTPFYYRGSRVRTVTGANGEPWFVAADVCAVLGLEQVSRAVARLDDDQRAGTQITSPNGRTVSVNIVSEPGLYDLVIRSDKPEARPFRRWVTTEVLPSIRRTGGDLLIDDLRWCFRRNGKRPEVDQRQVTNGRLAEKPQFRWNSAGERVLATPQVRITVKGLEFLHSHLKGTAPLAIEAAPAGSEVAR